MGTLHEAVLAPCCLHCRMDLPVGKSSLASLNSSSQHHKYFSNCPGRKKEDASPHTNRAPAAAVEGNKRETPIKSTTTCLQGIQGGLEPSLILSNVPVQPMYRLE
jgi:hypothetical protein